jgi:hypothetical protein
MDYYAVEYQTEYIPQVYQDKYVGNDIAYTNPSPKNTSPLTDIRNVSSTTPLKDKSFTNPLW